MTMNISHTAPYGTISTEQREGRAIRIEAARNKFLRSLNPEELELLRRHLTRRQRVRAAMATSNANRSSLDIKISADAKARLPEVLDLFLKEKDPARKQNLSRYFVRSWAVARGIEIREVGAWCNTPTENDEPLLTWEQVLAIIKEDI